MSDVVRATTFTPSSSLLGHSMQRTAPIPGMKIAPVSTQWSKPFMKTSVLSDEQHEAERQQGGGREQDGGVLLDPSALEGAQRLPAFLRPQAQRVDGSVDDGLVDALVDEPGDQLGVLGHAVDDGVDDVLVEPVGPLGQWVSDPLDDAAVEMVQVVLVDEQLVAGLGHLAALGQTAEPE